MLLAKNFIHAGKETIRKEIDFDVTSCLSLFSNAKILPK